MANTFRLPNIFSILSPLSLKAKTNPHHEQVKYESLAWLEQYGTFPKADAHSRLDVALLAANSFPTASYNAFRAISDWMYWFVAFDDLFDDGIFTHDPNGTRKILDITLAVLESNTLETPKAYVTDFKLGEALRDIWLRMLACHPSEGMKQRFIESTRSYFNGVHAQVSRKGVEPTSVEEYMRERFNTIGTEMFFALAELALEIDVPASAFQNEDLQSIIRCATHLCALINDTSSYNLEQSKGETNNLVHILQVRRSLSLQEAMDQAGTYAADNVKDWMEAQERLRRSNISDNGALEQYLQGIGYCVTGTLNWSLTTHRYFGREIEEVRRTLIVTLMPKKATKRISRECANNGTPIKRANVQG